MNGKNNCQFCDKVSKDRQLELSERIERLEAIYSQAARSGCIKIAIASQLR
jgi:hypothetical protein